jgi:heavy metal sensor kinase
MRPVSIRVRLTLGYFAFFAVTFAVFGFGLFEAVRTSVHAAVDENLGFRLEGVLRIIQYHDPTAFPADFQDELLEHSELTPGGDLLQIADSEGNWLFRSAEINDYAISLPSGDLNQPRYETQVWNGIPLRVLSTTAHVPGNRYTVQLAAPLTGAYDALQRLKWLLVSSIPIVLLLCCLGGYWMSRRALTPVNDIARTARSVSEHSLSKRLRIVPTGDELQHLSETFNQMMDRLEAAFKRITQFTADASHELRTPTALIRTTAELSLRREREQSDYRESLAQILEEAERMGRLIDNLMTLARMDSGAEGLTFEDIDIAALLRETCVTSQPLFESKRIQFNYSVPNSPIFVTADLHALRRVFLILIDNAVKYTPAGGRVLITLHENGNEVLIEVQDNGVGIAGEDLPAIFERFYRADKARSKEPGAGLGLSIARWIVESHRASIDVESMVGEGSTFRVRFCLSNRVSDQHTLKS